MRAPTFFNNRSVFAKPVLPCLTNQAIVSRQRLVAILFLQHLMLAPRPRGRGLF